MRRLGFVLLLIVAAGSLAGAAASRTFTNAATYEDERGEESGAPDITRVSVSNDDHGDITFFASVPSHPVLTEDMRIRLWISDGNPATGLAEGGADQFVLVDGFLLGLGNAVLYDCAGTVCETSTPSSDVQFSYTRGASLTLPADALGIPVHGWGSKRLDFSVFVGAGYGYDPQTRRFNLANVHVDEAPTSRDWWTYAARIGPSALVAKEPTTRPAVARAGRPLAVRMRVDRDDTGTAIRSGVVTCSAHVGSRRLASESGRFVERHAFCVLRIPAGTVGRTLRGSISVSRGELKTQRSFVRLIR